MIWLNWNFFIQIFILIYFLAINGIYSFLMIVAFIEFRNQHRRSFIDDYPYLYRSKLTPGVSILVPAYNEEATVIEALKSHLSTRYPKFEVIVINDGSKDKTLEILKKEFKLKKIYHVMQTRIKTKSIRGYYISASEPNLIVLDKINGGKADTLNAGINASNYPYFISIDADVILEEDAMLRIMKPMLENPEKNMVAGGMVRVANGCVVENGKIKEVRLSKKFLPVFQVIEYMRAFTAGRAGFSKIKSLLIVSGAFGVFNTEEVRKAGGYERKTVGEDMELLVRLHRSLREQNKDYNILFMTYPVCWTEVPESLRILGRQRNRWHRGLCDTLTRHKKMILNPRYGTIGLVGMPFFVFFEFLGPIIELVGYLYVIYLIVFGIMNWSFFLLFLALAVLWSVLLSVSAVLFEDINFKRYGKWYYIAVLILFSLFENFGYRHLTLMFRIHGLFDYLRGRKAWGVMSRKGFN